VTPNSWVVVVSAGRNGILETMHSGTGAGLTENPTVGGDDVIARVR
jgi:hypothetical protein